MRVAWRVAATRVPGGEPLELGIGPDGRWTHSPPGGEIESHVELQRRTVARAAQAVSASVV